jgi:hypothetical protein
MYIEKNWQNVKMERISAGSFWDEMMKTYK